MVSNRAVWTRAPAGTIAIELQGEITLMDPGGAEGEALAPDIRDPPEGPGLVSRRTPGSPSPR